MKLKIRKKIMASNLFVICLALISTLGFKSMPVNAITITNSGISEYNGILNDQAFAWTGANVTGFVSAQIEVAGVPNYFIGYQSSSTGWVQTNQVTYKSSQARGHHWAGISGIDVCDSDMTYP